jgi:hypothetical protein
MPVAGKRGRETLAHVLHVDVGDRDFASADSRSLALVLRRHDPIVVIGMLEEVLRGNAIAGGAGIACELQILLEHLIGVAADPDVGAAAIVGMRLALSPAAATTAMSTMRAAVRFARAATAAASILVIRSHASITSHCCGPGFALRQSHRKEFVSGKIRKRAQSSSGALTPGDRHSDVGGRIRGAVQRLSPAAVFRMFTPKPKRP